MRKILRAYKQFANIIDEDIIVKKTSCEWYCYPNLKEIYVPQLTTEQGDKEFVQSFIDKLPQDKRNLIEELPIWILSFLHEIGHIQCGHGTRTEPLAMLANFFGRLGYYKISNFIYFKIKREKQATQWAIDYTINNYDTVWNYTEKISKAYQKYYRKLKIDIDE